MRRAFTQCFFTCVLNPKAYMFTLAVYPQFMLPEYGPVWAQALAMGVITVVAHGGIYGGLGFAAAKARDFLTGSPAVTIWIGRGAGRGCCFCWRRGGRCGGWVWGDGESKLLLAFKDVCYRLQM